jgi:hypothetical protein
MSNLLEKALEKVVELPQDEQDAIASQILASIADENAWKKRFAEKRDVIRRMAREALEEDERGETLPLDDLLRCSRELRANSSDCFRTPPSTLNAIPNALRLFQNKVYSSKSWKAKITSIRFVSVWNIALWA